MSLTTVAVPAYTRKSLEEAVSRAVRSWAAALSTSPEAKRTRAYTNGSSGCREVATLNRSSSERAPLKLPEERYAFTIAPGALRVVGLADTQVRAVARASARA